MVRDISIAFLFLASVAVLIVLYRTSIAAPRTLVTAEFGGVSLSIDYATTTAARELGLGGRTGLPDDYGMLFVFPEDDYYGFWMKDTLVSLDIFWLNSKGQVVYIAENVQPESYPNVFYPTVPARYVLETVAGFARTHGVTAGTPLQLKNLPTVSK